MGSFDKIVESWMLHQALRSPIVGVSDEQRELALKMIELGAKYGLCARDTIQFITDLGNACNEFNTSPNTLKAELSNIINFPEGGNR